MVGVSPSLLPPSFVVGESPGFDRLSCVLLGWRGGENQTPSEAPTKAPLWFPRIGTRFVVIVVYRHKIIKNLC